MSGLCLVVYFMFVGVFTYTWVAFHNIVLVPGVL